MLQEVINDEFVPSLAGEDTPFTPTQNRLFSLPASQGGLGIPQLKEQASIQFSASLNLTSAHRESIKDQDTCIREKNRDGHTQSRRKKERKKEKIFKFFILQIKTHSTLIKSLYWDVIINNI